MKFSQGLTLRLLRFSGLGVGTAFFTDIFES